MSQQYAFKNTRNLSQKQHYTDIQVDIFFESKFSQTKIYSTKTFYFTLHTRWEL